MRATKVMVVLGAVAAALAASSAGAWALADRPERPMKQVSQPALRVAEVPPPAAAAPSAGPGAPPAGSTPPATTGPASTPAAAAPPKAAAPPATSSCPTGERQRDVENYLSRLTGYGPIVADGVQTDADCATIKKFQQRFGIQPANGRAGPTTADVARRIASVDLGRCQAGAGVTACIDLTLQVMWVVRDGAVVLGPTVVRTGMAGGFQTPAGHFKVTNRNVKEWSKPYEVWLPYWQHFQGGMGFHETTTYLHDPFGSHGCVNLLPGDARALWNLTAVGTPIHSWGRRPGT
jgi:hypothetical protein